MKFTQLLGPLGLFALGVQAGPWGSGHGGGWGGWNGKCLTDAQAQSIVDRSITYLEHTDLAAATAAGQSLFADNIVEFGDSINSLRGDALGNQVEFNKTTYLKETLGSPPIPSIQTVDIIKDCSKFVWQWQFNGIGSGQYRVRGVTIITVDLNSGLVTNQYVEFNSLAWAQDVGFTVTPPAGGGIPGK